ncbi:MAG: hypothetical protein K1V72_09145, partial [Duncaniella sp.]
PTPVPHIIHPLPFCAVLSPLPSFSRPALLLKKCERGSAKSPPATIITIPVIDRIVPSCTHPLTTIREGAHPPSL